MLMLTHTDNVNVKLTLIMYMLTHTDHVHVNSH